MSLFEKGGNKTQMQPPIIDLSFDRTPNRSFNAQNIVNEYIMASQFATIALHSNLPALDDRHIASGCYHDHAYAVFFDEQAKASEALIAPQLTGYLSTYVIPPGDASAHLTRLTTTDGGIDLRHGLQLIAEQLTANHAVSMKPHIAPGGYIGLYTTTDSVTGDRTFYIITRCGPASHKAKQLRMKYIRNKARDANNMPIPNQLHDMAISDEYTTLDHETRQNSGMVLGWVLRKLGLCPYLQSAMKIEIDPTIITATPTSLIPFNAFDVTRTVLYNQCSSAIDGTGPYIPVVIGNVLNGIRLYNRPSHTTMNTLGSFPLEIPHWRTDLLYQTHDLHTKTIYRYTGPNDELQHLRYALTPLGQAHLQAMYSIGDDVTSMDLNPCYVIAA